MSYFIITDVSSLDYVSYMEFEDKIIPYKKHNGRRIPIVIEIPHISTLSIERKEKVFVITKETIKQFTHTDERHELMNQIIDGLKNSSGLNHTQFLLGKGLKVKGDVSSMDKIFVDDREFNLNMFVVVREIRYKQLVMEIRQIEATEETSIEMNVDIEENEDTVSREDDARENKVIETNSTNELQEYSLNDVDIDTDQPEISLNDKKTTIKNLYTETLEKAKKAQELAQIYFAECERLREMYYELE